MNKHIIKMTLMAVFAAMFLQSCLEDKCKNEVTYTYYEPVYLMTEEIRVDIIPEGPREMNVPGKMYFYNNFVFVNELNEGIHVIDNANPSSPENVAFIPILGNVDLAVKDNILYADSYMDLLAINISNPILPSLEKRVEDVFSWYSYDVDFGYTVEYRRTERTEKRNCDEYYALNSPFLLDQNDGVFVNEGIVGLQNGVVPTPGGDVGIAGSMARFGLYSDYLYVIDRQNLDVFDISTITCPEEINTIYVGLEIETIFPHGNNLFIGAANGMYIFDNSNPTSPTQLSLFQHANACDPVYVKGNKAYVTLRSGTECDGFTNQLDIVDISNLENPWLIASHGMENPHGLSVTNSNKVFLCEGSGGLKILDVTNSQNVIELGTLTGFDAYDAIALGENHVMVIGRHGFYQFDTTDPNNINQLSLIPVSN